MIKILHIAAVGALIASASYAYTIKYETLYQSGELAKLKTMVHREREAIAVLQAEWQHLNRPDRLQMLADAHTQLQPSRVEQLVRFSDVPARSVRTDTIADKLEALSRSADARPVASIPRAQTAGNITPRPNPKPQTLIGRTPASAPGGPQVVTPRAVMVAPGAPRQVTAVAQPRPLSLTPPRPIPNQTPRPPQR